MKGKKQRLSLKTINVVSLESHVMDGFKDEKEAIRHFANEYGLITQQVKRWISSGAAWFDGQIYLQKSKFCDSKIEIGEDSKAFILADFISVHFDDNATSFAEHHGSTQQQACRWLKANTIYIDGEVFRQQTNFTSE